MDPTLQEDPRASPRAGGDKPRQQRGAGGAGRRCQKEAEGPLTWMSLFRILPTAGNEPSPRCCRTIQPLAAATSCGSMKMKLRACAKDFRTKAVSLK